MAMGNKSGQTRLSLALDIVIEILAAMYALSGRYNQATLLLVLLLVWHRND